MLNQIRSFAAIAYHYLTDNRYREFYSQRRIQNLSDRIKAADDFARRLPRPPAQVSAEVASHLEQLERDGITFLDELITEQQVRDIREYFANQLCRDPHRPQLGSFFGPDGIPPETHVAHYSDDQILAAPHVLEIANHPRVLAIVAGYLDAQPTLASLRVWWSTPTPSGEPEHAERFHRDVDDLRFLKLFVYLTDVNDDSGPHVLAMGTHKVDALTRIGRYEDSEVEQIAGDGKVVRLCGKAGTSFLENTYCLHRGMPPTHQPRLIMQPLYTLRPVIFGPKRPVVDGGRRSGFDPYVNRVYIKNN